MSREFFWAYMEKRGIYEACLFADFHKIPLGIAQLWIKTRPKA